MVDKAPVVSQVVTPVREWLDARTVERPGNVLKAREDAFADYQEFAQQRNETAMTLTAFGLAMKREGIAKDTDSSKRSFYRNIAIAHRSGLRAVK